MPCARSSGARRPTMLGTSIRQYVPTLRWETAPPRRSRRLEDPSDEREVVEDGAHAGGGEPAGERVGQRRVRPLGDVDHVRRERRSAQPAETIAARANARCSRAIASRGCVRHMNHAVRGFGGRQRLASGVDQRRRRPELALAALGDGAVGGRARAGPVGERAEGRHRRMGRTRHLLLCSALQLGCLEV